MIEVLDNVVIAKGGTSVLTYKNSFFDKQYFDMNSFQNIAKEVSGLSDAGKHPAVVSSAGIVGGMLVSGTEKRPDPNTEMPELQRLSSLGTRHLLNTWDQSFKDKNIGGVFITSQELEHDEERNELMAVTHSMLRHGDVPIFNENDTITHAEISFGDNDILAARLAGKIATSELFGDNVSLVIFTDVDGVLEDPSNPKTRIELITDIDSYMPIAGDGGTYTKGGMKSKLEAAAIATAAGVDVWICNGRTENVLEKAFAGETGTYLPATQQLAQS